MGFNYKDEAHKYACELAKIVCANPGYASKPNEKSANEIADFIETLEKRLHSESKPESNYE